VSEPAASMVLWALSFAARRHEGQVRKDGRTPYIAHPARVLAIMSIVFGVEDPETLAAAVLHDTIEDTTTDRDDLIEHFGPRVAEFVALLSKDTRLPEPEREARYLATLAAAPLEVKLCKLADTYDNMIDSSCLPEALRAKKRREARRLIELFEPGFPAPWRHVLDVVSQASLTDAAGAGLLKDTKDDIQMTKDARNPKHP